MLATAHDRRQPCATTRAIVDQRIDEIDQIIVGLSELRAALADTRDTNTEKTAATKICPVIEKAERADADELQRANARRHVRR
ncbi:hypothetical protein [Mycobacterium sp. 852014-52144_SCH5372336]|uniref:hypothetical protein n=1 Tax=Mycobacterium sp. 852014-52144_SCH5372336 TaxID=1834115 RepID=UPI001E61433A|nr:hypothetical protein [Mycobacterium sp. 852014-52144_SCH5372336]